LQDGAIGIRDLDLRLKHHNFAYADRGCNCIFLLWTRYNKYKKTIMKILKWVLLIIVLGIITIVFLNYPKLNIISGYAAKNMASSIYIAHRPEAVIKQRDNNVPLIRLAETRVDKTGTEVSATVFGLMERKALCSKGLGCVLLPEGMKAANRQAQPHRAIQNDSLPYPFGDGAPRDSVFPEVNYALLKEAIGQAFKNNETQRTRTVLVVYKNHLLAERYVDGFSKDTPILGWSMTKSVLATLFGILEYQGKITIASPAPVPEWQGDARKDITLDNLLRMQSGLEWDEDYTSISDVTRMLFMEEDMTLAQREKQPIAKPTEVWNYSSGTANLLSGILRSILENYQEYLDFPYAALIDKIGMSSMLLETDLAGNFVGSSYGWASTRDWGRFGLLYLNRGNWNGEQVFDPGWVAYVTRPTAHSNGRYGAHFWLNAGSFLPDIPQDLYSAEGYQGQYVFIIPSRDLVVVRTGLAESPDFDINTFLKMLLSAIDMPEVVQ
jgi:CubicO group peptidase (beta-lactamase class C family)